MTVIKTPFAGEIHAVTDRNFFTEHEFYEFLIDNKYISEGDEETCQELWESQMILIEVSKRMPVKTRCGLYTDSLFYSLNGAA